ncbi:WD-40 repeat protein, partial [Reticulomyxa filosa]
MLNNNNNKKESTTMMDWHILSQQESASRLVDITKVDNKKPERTRRRQIKKKKGKKEIEMILEGWRRSCSIYFGWINEFDKIIIKFLQFKFFRAERLQGHEDTVDSIQFSRDGKKLISSSLDRTTQIWDVASGKTLQILRERHINIRNARFSPNGKFVVSASKDKIVRLWNAISGQIIREFRGHSDIVTCVQFSPTEQ